MVPPATAVATMWSAFDTNFRRSKESGSACYGRSGNGIPRSILIFFAATENGSACYGRSGNVFPRSILISVAAEKNGSACRTGLLLLRFLISGGELGNHCSFLPGNGL